jgi:hypothetical protein
VSYRGLFIYSFIHHDSMQPKGYGPLEKQTKFLERGRTNNPEVMHFSPIEQVQNAKRECGTAISNAANSK